ncbi:hypothetical protein [Microvirga lotononidis]|uniref:Uncharacterized protein n=1 Tax=Microvirga lotononidis TaxID=864069 RepID=I4YSB3_9HYPH|nr:hypothetical protein [Microvirga lotononidis]EIM26855.1 hypothetical protein MicloDRAFT_00034060 [Microvirga lotononidis]WQO31410.1 hypothetical protein U0023_34570 [Microvirga lotononidis]
MLAYNLFRRKGEADLFCAVPEDIPVPAFLTPEAWEYGCSVDIQALSGFDAEAAEISAGANGFYLFHSAS